MAREAGTSVGTYDITVGSLSSTNYNLTFTAATDAFSITAKPLIVTGAAVTSKTYNGNTVAVISGAALSGVESGDTVTLGNATAGTFASANIGTGISVATAPMTISGAQAGNYTLTQPTLTGDITPVQMTITAPTITKTKTYDTNATAAVIKGTLSGKVGVEDVDVTAAASYDDENVGTGKTITVVYTLTGTAKANYLAPVNDTAADGVISPISLTVAAPTLTKTKVYDNTTAATVTAGGLSGVIGGEAVTVSAAASYDDENVGTGKTITIVYTLGGADAGNYTKPGNETDATGVITPKAVNITAQTDTKVYDGDNTSSVLPIGDALISGDTYTSVGTQTFADADAGADKVITPAGATINDGNSGNNYNISYVTAAGTITKFDPVITWTTPDDIIAGTALSGAQLNAAITDVDGDPLAGTFTYTPVSGTVYTAVGTQTLSADFAPTDATNYNTPETKTVSINIIPAAIAKLQISADPTNLSVADTSVITVTGQDQYGNTTTGNNTTQPVLSISGDGGSLASTVLTLTSGVATTSLSKISAGVARVNASSGSLIPTEVAVTFTAGPSVPTLAVVAPTAGATLSATTTLTFTTNSGATTDAYISIDGGEYVAATTNANPGTYVLDTTSLANGSHTLRVKDTVSGLTGYSDYVTFLVSNASDTTRPLFSSQVPAASSTNVSITPDDLYVSFNEALDPATIGSTTVMLCLVDDPTCANPVNIGSPMLTEQGKMIRLGGPSVTLSYNTPYWIKVTTGIADLAGNHLLTDYGSTTTSQFTTESAPTGALAVGNISQVRYWGVANGGYDNGWEWVMPATIPTDANHFHLKFADWTSGGNTLPVAGNMKYWSEEITSGLSGSESNPVLITAANTYPDDIILNTDNNTSPDAPGMQTNIHIQVQIPDGQAGGSYSTSYGIDN